MRGDWSSDDENSIPWAMWQHNVNRSLSSPKGQVMLRRLEAALLALPERKLIGHEVAAEGMVCAIGALEAHTRVAKYGWTWEEVIPSMEEEYDDEGNEMTLIIGKSLGFTRTVAAEIASINDEDCYGMPPEERYEYVLRWVQGRIEGGVAA